MRKRQALLFGFGLLAIVGVVGFLAFWQAAPRHRINDQSVKLIQAGMTLEEVSVIFGVPPGDYSQKKGPRISFGGFTLGPEAKRWIDDEMTVAVSFNSSGNVESCQIEIRTFRVNESFLAKIRRWLGL